jgi:hypothetical protein
VSSPLRGSGFSTRAMAGAEGEKLEVTLSEASDALPDCFPSPSSD